MPVMFPALDFFVARAPEAESLFHSLKMKHAVMPRHARRRIRGFRPYFLRPKPPKNCKFFLPQPMSRRTRRKHGMYSLGSPNEKLRLPVTHVWHAKRFRMEPLWGMRLPVNVHNSGERDIYRRIQKECVFHDRSYWDCWQFPEKTVEGVLPGSVFHHGVRSGSQYCGGLWRLDGHVVSAYQAYWENGQLFLWTHPAARPECHELVRKSDGRLVNNMSRFELIGPKSLFLLNKVLGTELEVAQCVPGKVMRAHGKFLVFARDSGRLIEVVVADRKQAFSVWLKMAQAGISAMGVNDRHQALLRKYESPDFPNDFPTSKAGARYAAHLAQTVLKYDNSRPKHCKMEIHHVASPFFPDWSIVDTTVLAQTVVLKPIGKGSLNYNAHIFHDDKLVGFVTSTASDRGDVALASIYVDGDVKMLHVQNPGSSHRIESSVAPAGRETSETLLIGLVSKRL